MIRLSGKKLKYSTLHQL